MTKLRFAAFGAGFWAHYQLAAWKELKGVECVAVYNRTRAKAEKLAHKLIADISRVVFEASAATESRSGRVK